MRARIEYNKKCDRHPFMKYIDKKTLGLDKNTFYDKAVHVCPMCVIEARKIVHAFKDYAKRLDRTRFLLWKAQNTLRGADGKYRKK